MRMATSVKAQTDTAKSLSASCLPLTHSHQPRRWESGVVHSPGPRQTLRHAVGRSSMAMGAHVA